MANRIQKQISLSSKDQIQALEDIATEMGAGHVSGLMQAIAQREIPLLPHNDELQSVLVQAVFALQGAGEVTAASQLASWCLKHVKLKPEQEIRLSSSIASLVSPWVKKIEECIEKQQPFQLSYLDAASRQWSYMVRYAELAFREKRNYLECWCEEIEGNQDLPELRHNWSLRLDRITDAGIVPVGGVWRQGLDTVEVEFNLFGGLAHAYQQRDTDIAVEWLSVEPQTLRVIRQISNTFWFVREVLPYGKDCVVLEPYTVRQKVHSHLQAACDRYK